MVDQCYIVRFEKRSREFWSLARLTIQLGSRRETDCPQFLRGTRCARLESMVRIPEAGRSMPEQVEASRRGGGGPNQF